VPSLLGEGTIHEQGQFMEAFAPERRDVVAEKLLHMAGPARESELLTVDGAHQLPCIGFHTARHDPLTHLDDERLARALADGRAALAEVAGSAVDTIAYPHGNCDSRVIEAARQRDFAIGLTCQRTAVTPEADPLAFGRYEPPAGGGIGEFAFDLARTLMIAPSS
jgi:peptidoglycan/xylan/chitin deacetylase (PgdA/CDA1 family)